MIENCFDVLAIAPTKNEKEIKKAYHKLLHTVNPEDDREGFQRLREAYEEACRYAKKKEDFPKKSISEQFVERCQEVYDSFFRRVDSEEWEALFQDPVCLNLETGEKIRKAFLTFLMEHFHFPAEIWRLIDQTFAISHNRKELIEWFPEDFVDFLRQIVKDEGILNYKIFEGEVDADFDGYIDTYQKLRQYVDLGLMEQSRKQLELLKKFAVYHPYGEIEEARILLYEGKAEEAGKIFLRLGKAYPEEERIVCCYGQFLQMENRWNELEGIYDLLLQNNPDSVPARNGKAEELLHKGAYREARDIILDLLEYSPQEERLLKDLTDANVFMIQELEPQWKENQLTQDAWMELAWCYYQNMKFEESLQVLDSYEPDEEHVLDYHNLKGRVYLTQDKNEEALEHLIPWLNALLKLSPDGTKKTQRRLARLGYAYYTIGSAKAAILLKEKTEDFSEVMWYFEKAIAEEKEESQIVSYYHTMADVWRQKKQYDKVVEACDHILLYNQGYYPAILLRQEAYLFLGMYQEVADDYQRAVQMYPYFGKPYATLIKMYFMFGEYEKIKEIFKITEQLKIDSDELNILQARYKAVTAKTQDDLKEALAILDTLKEKGWSLQSDLEREDWGEVEYRRGLILSDLGRLEEAGCAFRTSMEEGEEDASKCFSYAAVLMQTEKYEEAIRYLEKALRFIPGDDGILYRLGWCYKLKKEYKTALRYMKQVLKNNPNHPHVRHAITEIYERMARKEENNAYYVMALPYMEEQVKRYPEEYYMVEMGLLYLDMDRYELALHWFQKAQEKNPESIYAFNNAGNCYLSMNMPEKAEPCFLEAVRLMKNEMTPLPYNNLAKCYRMMGDYEAALFCYQKNMDLFPEHLDLYLLLGDFYRENRQYEKAVATYQRGMKSGEKIKALGIELLRTYGIQKNHILVKEYGEKLKEKYPADVSVWQMLGEIYLFSLEQYEEARKFLEHALHLAKEKKDPEGIRGSLYLIGRSLLLQNKKEEAQKQLKQYLYFCRGKDGTSRQYEEFYGERGRRKFRLGCAFIFLEDFVQAQQCFHEMCTEKYRCDGCAKPFCHDRMAGEALLLWAQGKKREAVALYQSVIEQVSDDMEHCFEYKQMKKWEESQ